MWSFVCVYKYDQKSLRLRKHLMDNPFMNTTSFLSTIIGIYRVNIHPSWLGQNHPLPQSRKFVIKGVLTLSYFLHFGDSVILGGGHGEIWSTHWRVSDSRSTETDESSSRVSTFKVFYDYGDDETGRRVGGRREVFTDFPYPLFTGFRI